MNTRQKQNLKYGHLTLPEQVDSFHGFHMPCYRIFSALSKAQRKKMQEEDMQVSITQIQDKEEKPSTHSTANKNTYLTRSTIDAPKPSNSSGIFPKVCLFCCKKDKKVGNNKQKLVSASTDNFEANVRKYARWREDVHLQARISNTHFATKEIKYHNHCRLQYQKVAENTLIALQEKKVDNPDETRQSSWHEARYIHSEAFEALTYYVQETIIEDNEVHLLKDINSYYQALLHEIGKEKGYDLEPSTQKLEAKLVKHFGDQITITKSIKGRGMIIYSSSIDVEEVVRKQQSEKTNANTQLKNIAFKLREAVFNAENRQLPANLTIQDVKRGEIDVPDIICQFLTYLIGGPDTRRSNSPPKLRRIKSISEDLVFAVTSGKKKPSKHLTLGLAIKSMSGSRKIVEILNRLGHCASYHTVEELETELTFEANKDQKTMPHGMIEDGDLGTGVAFDNYDRFVETLSGKNTLHDTVGIAYQVYQKKEVNHSEQILEECSQVDLGMASAANNNNKNKQTTSVKKRRRTYEAAGLDIEPYRKKPKMNKAKFLPINDERRLYVPDSKRQSWLKDVLWMADILTNDIKGTPMWVGWNALLHPQYQHIQKIWYMRQLNQSPTSNSVVVETMKKAQRVAEEAHKDNIAVTYDLAIAKVAMQIQAEESPKYDNLFIAMGAFHIEMALFHAIGKFVEESGGPYVLNECNVLAKGSLKGFITGKSYKRSKRLHQLLSVAFEILHFKSYLSNLQNTEEAAEIIKSELDVTKHHAFTQSYTPSVEFGEIMKGYEQYLDETEKGNHGKTAQYWITYVGMIHLYHEFIRSIRVGDIELYTYCLPKIGNLFFGFNHPNYARWIVRYHDNIMKLKETHPIVYEEFKKGWFSLQRTTKSFSAQPIDLTLEQTINADAASQRTGIGALTNSISARQRWTDSHFVRTEIISHVLEDLSMTKKEDVSQDLKSSQIKRNSQDLAAITTSIEEMMNPFSDDIDKNTLYNIGTGKSASKETTEFLLSLVKTGSDLREKFLNECISNPKRFEESISRRKIKNFATEAGIHKIRGPDQKVVAVSMVRDIFGSILYLSLQKKVDMAEVLKYPLTPVPLSLSHVDGTMQKTTKASLMKHLESKVVTNNPTRVDCTIIDAMFFLHLQFDLPTTFGEISQYLLKKICQTKSDTIHFVFDKTVSPSIKDCERDKRMINGRTSLYHIAGPGQKRPSSWMEALRNDQFKESLVDFLVQSWEDDNLVAILKEKVLYANGGDICYSYKVCDGKMVRNIEPFLCCTHEEADSSMIYHLKSITAPNNVVIRTADTDVLIIALGCFSSLNQQVNTWLEVGLYTKNTLRYISVNQLFLKLGDVLCKSLPAYHAFTGCDYTASFSRKGKIQPFKLLEKNKDIQELFGELGQY